MDNSKANEFARWIQKTVTAGRAELGLEESTIAYVLLREGMGCYHRTIGECGRCALRKDDNGAATLD